MFKIFQLQRLIHLLLESLSSLLESLNAITDTRKLSEGLVQSIDELVPSLRKIRKLAGIFSFCFPDMYIITLHDFRITNLFFLLLIQFHRTTGHAFEIHYISLGMWGAVLLWFCIIRGMMNLAINTLYSGTISILSVILVYICMWMRTLSEF